MTKRIILSIAVLLFVAGGVWIACNETTVAPPSAPSATSPDKGWTAAGSESSGSEVTLNPTLASQRPSRDTGFAAVMTHLRLEDTYGERWDEVASLIHAIAVLKGADRRAGIFGEMLDPLKLARWKSDFPTRSTTLATDHAEKKRAWDAGRETIRAAGQVPVPPTYEAMLARENRMSQGERAALAIELLKEYVEHLKVNIASRERSSAGGAMLSTGYLAAVVQRRAVCRQNCFQRASSVYWTLVGICDDEYQSCCREGTPSGRSICYAGSDRREDCLWDREDCVNDALDVYTEWYHRCVRAC